MLNTLRQAFPVVSSYDLIASVVQASAEGHRVKLHYEDGDENSMVRCPRLNEVFVKQVEASKYVSKSWPDFRRTLMYLRSEVRFYNEILPLLLLQEDGRDSAGFLAAPEIYLASYQLDGLIDENEKATEQSTKSVEDPLTLPCLSSKDGNKDTQLGGFIIMQCIGQSHYQDSPISLDQSKQCLEAVASLHAAAWEDQKLLQLAEERLSRGSYHLSTRNPKELAGMEKSWESFVTNFQDQDPDLFARCSKIGKKVFDLAEYVSQEISPGPNDKYATLAHGDFKAMNCFLPTNENGTFKPSSDDGCRNNVVIVDFASTGVGLGMSDVAMHLHHAVRPEDLANGGEEELLNHYLTVLNVKLSALKKSPYPRDLANRHYRLAVVDYFRFVLGRFWKTATIEAFDKKKDNKNVVYVNRNISAALAFLDRADRYIDMIQSEIDSITELDACQGAG